METAIDIKKTHHQLPPEVADAFAALGKTGDTETRNLYLAKLRKIGWTLQSLSDVSGITRERVRQIATSLILVSDASATGEWSLPLPTPPEKPSKGSQKREYIEPSPEGLKRLLELQPAAQSVRSNSTKNREEAEEYTALLWKEHNEGKVTLYRLAKRLGVSHGALRFRLARYGYKLPTSGKSKVYEPIKTANRLPAS